MCENGNRASEFVGVNSVILENLGVSGGMFWSLSLYNVTVDSCLSLPTFNSTEYPTNCETRSKMELQPGLTAALQLRVMLKGLGSPLRVLVSLSPPSAQTGPAPPSHNKLFHSFNPQTDCGAFVAV